MFDMFTPGDYIKMLSLACLYICTRGKLSREKTFVNFVVLWVYIHESFLCKIWEHGVLWYSKSEQSTTKVSLVFPAMWYAQDGLTDICKVLLSIINCTDLISIYSSYIPPIDHKSWHRTHFGQHQASCISCIDQEMVRLSLCTKCSQITGFICTVDYHHLKVSVSSNIAAVLSLVAKQTSDLCNSA